MDDLERLQLEAALEPMLERVIARVVKKQLRPIIDNLPASLRACYDTDVKAERKATWARRRKILDK